MCAQAVVNEVTPSKGYSWNTSNCVAPHVCVLTRQRDHWQYILLEPSIPLGCLGEGAGESAKRGHCSVIEYRGLQSVATKQGLAKRGHTRCLRSAHHYVVACDR